MTSAYPRILGSKEGCDSPSPSLTAFFQRRRRRVISSGRRVIFVLSFSSTSILDILHILLRISFFQPLLTFAFHKSCRRWRCNYSPPSQLWNNLFSYPCGTQQGQYSNERRGQQHPLTQTSHWYWLGLFFSWLGRLVSPSLS